ncbi:MULTISPECIES: hypothetical protein [Brucella/Ochrobactrum group]|uniref:hypothetical protein n=1 Tax=Brucella/Ochrobactrum group TaxID=2826938 RepID=UPI001C05C635|nr:hypothetical protein [Brucella sp. NBRC 12950]QWK81499.1 hypothetical protein KMS41_27320 [Ochrobactrum sp. BTU1]GLU29960.1 hypothetical protein Brsp01_51930 [Brucella sp. NBRC 12950]
MLKPRHPGKYPERELDCQEAVANEIMGLIASARNAGWEEAETAAAIAIVAQGLISTFNIEEAENRSQQ